MKLKNVLYIALLSTFIISCSDDDDQGGVPGDEVAAPATYVFEREGESSVSFSGQTTRILMGEEIIAKFLDNTATTEELKAMFAHEEGN
ncbi:MAG: DUF4856 domain-containing protein, partial [Bacteroidota bacterium]